VPVPWKLLAENAWSAASIRRARVFSPRALLRRGLLALLVLRLLTPRSGRLDGGGRRHRTTKI
jgi:hypothetical protein